MRRSFTQLGKTISNYECHLDMQPEAPRGTTDVRISLKAGRQRDTSVEMTFYRPHLLPQEGESRFHRSSWKQLVFYLAHKYIYLI